MNSSRNPQLNRSGELHAPAALEGLPRRGHHAHPRHRRAVRRRHRARSEEGAAAARQERVQPVLRELDAHAHDLRDRRQAAVGRRDQPQHRRVVDDQGRVAARHRRQPLRDACRHVRRAPRAVGRAVPDRVAPRHDGPPHVHVVNAGDGRHAHPTQGLLDMYTIRHYKKDFRELTVAIVGDVLHSRVARSQIHALTTLRRRGARDRAADAAADGVEALGVRVHQRHARRACATATSSSCCGCRTSA